jgi:hypothetical protein
MRGDMSTPPVNIPRSPALTPSSDFYALRRTGIGYIEELASELWTDYNPHDPGITLLEQLCFALTDLAYRNGWDIKDLLMPATPSSDPAQPYPNQTFFTAREILTVNPVTPDDFRRLLIGRAALRNAWVFCKQCACDVAWYSACIKGKPVLSFSEPDDSASAVQRVEVRGLYDVLLELEADPELGDLNDRKIWLEAEIDGGGGKTHDLRLELRFPEWELSHPDQWRTFVDSASIDSVKLVGLGARADYNLLTDPSLDEAGRNAYLRTHWNYLLLLTFELTYPSGPVLTLPNVALHFFGPNAARSNLTLTRLKEILEDEGAQSAMVQYREKLRRAEQAVLDARQTLSAHRNLDEEFCHIAAVAIEDVAACAEIEVSPGADIERVQAQAWFLIEQYMNPPIRHYSLQEMLDSGMPVEEIFNGPKAEGGFLRQDEVEAAQLKSVLRNSDLINLLMDIEGVVAVRSLLLSKYNLQGEIVKGAADPVLVGGNPVFDSNKGSAVWELYISPLHQPRLYFERSRFLFMKDGLPFLPRADEAMDALHQMRAETERGRIDDAQLDLPVPSGTYRPARHYPVQYGLPQIYGVSPAGLPGTASERRKGQAKQLQAYLMVFEQLLANAGEQLAHGADLFSLDLTVSRTYFAARLDKQVIADYDVVVDSLSPAALDAMTETEEEFLERRNRFLDHLLARFGESFAEYALLLSRGRRDAAGLRRLIADKIGFLERYPLISRERARARDIHHLPLAPESIPGLQKRVALLLGYPNLEFAWTMSAPGAVAGYSLKDAQQVAWLEGSFAAPITGADNAAAQHAAFHFVLRRLSQPGAYRITVQAGKYTVRLDDADGNEIGAAPTPAPSLAAAHALIDELVGWGSHSRAIVVEHLLLRPKFAGDALIRPCPEDECGPCMDSDPYSFRLTIVMPAWTAPFDADMDMRAFADRTIQRELPSHLLGKVCWVGNDGFVADKCAPIVLALAELLEREGLTEGGQRPDAEAACACANALYLGFSDVFADWYQDKTLDYHNADALRLALEALFAAQPQPGDFSCTTVLDVALFDKIRRRMVDHFHEIALHGWQFERFEAAWRAWVQADAQFEWGAEKLQDRVEAILAESLLSPEKMDALCGCAASIVIKWGEVFDQWMRAQMAAGLTPEAFVPFDEPVVTLCPGLSFKEDTQARIAKLLRDRYQAYVEVSYRLRVLLDLMSILKNAYPGATLHDCDEGSDVRPVRLGSTALGRTRARAAVPVEPEPEPVPVPGPEPTPGPAPTPSPLSGPGVQPAVAGNGRNGARSRTRSTPPSNEKVPAPAKKASKRSKPNQ